MSAEEPWEQEASGIEDEQDEGDRALEPYVQRYYDSLTQELLGDGFFDARLHRFHEGLNMPTDRVFYTAPTSFETIGDPGQVAQGHPLRAIAWILNQAAANSKVRIFCYRLTDPQAIDLLVHAGSNREVQVILHPHDDTRRELVRFANHHGKAPIIENMEIRLANLSGQPIRGKPWMHDKSIITDSYTTFGSYSLTRYARAGNWESLCVVETQQKSVEAFDELWNSLSERQMERFYPELDYPEIGPKRRRRQNLREEERRVRARTQQEGR